MECSTGCVVFLYSLYPDSVLFIHNALPCSREPLHLSQAVACAHEYVGMEVQRSKGHIPGLRAHTPPLTQGAKGPVRLLYFLIDSLIACFYSLYQT